MLIPRAILVVEVTGFEPVQVSVAIVRSHAEKRCYAAIFGTSADDHGMPICRFYHAKVCDKVCDNPLTHAAALSIIIVTVRAFPFSDIYLHSASSK